MAQGRDLEPRAPRWLNGVLCSSGLAGFALFIWRIVAVEGDVLGAASAPGGLLSRVLGAAILPLVVCAAALGRAARRTL